jgi:hypothetical protein
MADRDIDKGEDEVIWERVIGSGEDEIIWDRDVEVGARATMPEYALVDN